MRVDIFFSITIIVGFKVAIISLIRPSVRTGAPSPRGRLSSANKNINEESPTLRWGIGLCLAAEDAQQEAC
jgi:hypothetical protein